MSNKPIPISCFSYKGGSGRTTGVANLAGALAFLGKTVCIVDCDFEGTGLGLLYLNHLNFKLSIESKKSEKKILPDYYNENNERVEETFKKDFINKGFINERDFYYIDSGFGESRSTNKLSQYSNFASNELTYGEEKKSIRIFQIKTNQLIKLIHEAIPDCNYIIFDLQSGIRLFSSAFIKCSKKILLFFRYSAQHVEGTIETFKHYKSRFSLQLDYWLIPSAVPIKKSLNKKFNDIIDEYAERILYTGKMMQYLLDDKILEVHENNLLKVKEQNLFFDKERWYELRKIINIDLTQKNEVKKILEIILKEEKKIDDNNFNIKTMIEFLKIACKIQG